MRTLFCSLSAMASEAPSKSPGDGLIDILLKPQKTLAKDCMQHAYPLSHVA
jgi:hypothetical protein